jgi:hypothetical protein
MRRIAGYMVLGLGVVSLLIGGAVAPASALQLDATYFKIDATPGTNTDVNHCNTVGGCFGAEPGLVGTVGLTGLTNNLPTPTAGKWNNLVGGGVGLWNTSAPGVSFDTVKTGSLIGHQVDPFGFSIPLNFFAQNAANNNAFFQAVHWSGTFSTGLSGANFSLQADDHAFLYIDGILAADDGGVKGIDVAPAVAAVVAPGNHTLDLFFADVFHTQSGIIFSCTGCQDPIPSAVPEPASLLLFGTTLAGLGAMVRRKMQRTTEVSAS